MDIRDALDAGIGPTAHITKQRTHHENSQLHDDQVKGNGQDHQVDLVLMVEESKQQPEQSTGQHRNQQSAVGVAQIIGGEDAHKSAEQHLALQSEVEDTGLIAERAAQSGQQDRRREPDTTVEQFDSKNAEKSFHISGS